jgi:hypothetical protein
MREDASSRVIIFLRLHHVVGNVEELKEVLHLIEIDTSLERARSLDAMWLLHFSSPLIGR